ncbi:MAG: hypothetical protein ACP6IQ_02675 [Candidatus Njordarchaeia archaeon]
MKRRIIITYDDSEITPELALSYTKKVIEEGKISQVKNISQYCFFTVFESGISVYCREKYRGDKQADSFVVQKQRYGNPKSLKN